MGSLARTQAESALREGAAAVSAITFWEVGMRTQKGRLSLGRPLETWRRDLVEAGIVEIPVNGMIAARAGVLAEMHGDPADRIIVATAMEGHRLVTADERILRWDGDLDRLDARE
jgi:PIN domain nuclease of toxin-antitoxin system